MLAAGPVFMVTPFSRDPVELAKQVFDIAIGEADDTVSESKRHTSPKRKSGVKGGKARAKSLTVRFPQESKRDRLGQQPSPE